MVMGIKNPGYTLLNLYPSLPSSSTTSSSSSSSIPTFTERSCTLPDQISIYLYIYLPFSITLFLFFLLRKLRIVFSSYWFRNINRKRRNGTQVRGHNGLSTNGGGGHKKSLSRTLLSSKGGEDDLEGGGGDDDGLQEDEFSLFPTFGNTTPHSAEIYGYSANLGGGADGFEDGPISNRNSREWDQEDLDEDENWESGGGKKVRRVSKVWLWDSKSTSNNTTNSATSPTLPFSSSSNSNSYNNDSMTTSIKNRLSSILSQLLTRISQNTLLLPFLRLLRPLLRLVRNLVFVVFAKPLELLGRLLGGEKGIARAFKEAGKEFWEVCWAGLLLWVVGCIVWEI